MGILRPVIQAFMRTVFDARHDVAFGRAVGSEFVGDHHTGCLTPSFQKFSHQTLCGLGIAAALHQHIENEALLIDRPPQPLLLAANGDDDFIEIPFVAKLSGLTAPDFIGKVAPEFFGPNPDCLVRDNDPARRQ